MQVTGATVDELRQALAAINGEFDGNVLFDHISALSRTRSTYTLRVSTSQGKGAKRTVSGRRTVSACWHVHGRFFEEVFKICPDAVFRGGFYRRGTITKDAGNWEDWTEGSMMQWENVSNLCNCNT